MGSDLDPVGLEADSLERAGVRDVQIPVGGLHDLFSLAALDTFHHLGVFQFQSLEGDVGGVGDFDGPLPGLHPVRGVGGSR